ncbi:MAG: hypothetical protein CFE21_18920 [Bacteroidetes bacterium B1(2017)]|nr:MAG: hypothetical protein CFE21_18920 [Bacteroidetes bacterium B1(2017)]
MRESDPTNSDSTKQDENELFYQSSGHARNVCFVWSNEKRLFLNYAYLVSGEFNPNEEKNLITLTFSSHTVSLHGYNLETLFTALMEHLPRIIFEVDSRYALGSELRDVIIVEIIVEKKEA